MSSVRRTRRSVQQAAEAQFWLNETSLLRVLSFMDLYQLVNQAVLVCNRWRTAVASEPEAWSTAINDLDPLGVLSPEIVKTAAVRLRKQGGWIELASRLCSRACGQHNCTHFAMWFNAAKSQRVCWRHIRGDRPPFVLNRFMYDRECSVTVTNAAELQATAKAHENSLKSVRVEGHILLDSIDETLDFDGVRLVGPPCIDGEPQASITSLRTSLITDTVFIENLRIIVGREGDFCDFDEHFEPIWRPFPAIQLYGINVFKSCHIWGHQASQRCTLMHGTF